MQIKQLKVGRMLNFSYVLYGESRRAFCVDPSYGSTEIQSFLREADLKLDYILLTHHHFDHVDQAAELAQKTGSRVVAHKSSPYNYDVGVIDGQRLRAGEIEVICLHTPGHTKDSVCYLSSGTLFTGDTLFVGECGRVDLPGGSASEMYDSLFGKLVVLPDDTRVYPGHDYGDRPYSTIGIEKAANYVLRPRSKSEFERFMNN